jgi:hypothetical protein
MGSGLATDLTAMLAAGQDLRWERLAARIEGEREHQEVAWAVYRPRDVDHFRRDVAAMANGGGGYLLVGVPQRGGRAVPGSRPPMPLRVGVQHALAWFEHGMSDTSMSPMPNVEWFVAPATEDTGITVLRVAPAVRLPVAVARHRSWAVPFRRGRRVVHLDPWAALRLVEERDAVAPTVVGQAEPIGAA